VSAHALAARRVGGAAAQSALLLHAVSLSRSLLLERSSMLAARPTVAPQARRRLNGTARCSSATRPAWAGDDALSSFVNALIASPLYSLMKPLARYTLIDTAERNGIPWRAEVERQEAERARLEALRLALTDPSVSYPAYCAFSVEGLGCRAATTATLDRPACRADAPLQTRCPSTRTRRGT